MAQEQFIYFHKMYTPDLKTGVWQVLTKKHGTYLGNIKWHGEWECYAFFPEQETPYEERGLRFIAGFCESLTNKWKEIQEEKKNDDL